MASALLAASADAAPAWLPPFDVGSTQNPCTPTCTSLARPMLAMAGNGDLAIARTVPTPSFGVSAYLLRFRPAGGALGPDETIAEPGANQQLAGLEIGIDGAGGVTAVYNRYDGATSTDTVEARYRPPGGSFGPEQPLGTSFDSVGLSLAVSQGGAAAVGWGTQDNKPQVNYRPVGGSFGPVKLLAASGGPAVVAVDDAGHAIAVWNAGAAGLVSSFKPAGGDFITPGTPFGSGTVNVPPSVALDGSGSAVAVWVRYDGSHFVVERAIRPAGDASAFGSSAPLTPADGTSVSAPVVAADPAGEAVAAWTRQDSLGSCTEMAFRSAGGDFPSTPAPLDCNGGIDPVVAVSGTGAALVAWIRNRSGAVPASAHAVARPPGGAFGPPAPVVTAAPSDALSAPAGAGVDAQGNGATAWSEFADTGASTEVVRAAGYDGAGPRLSNLAVPASGVAGQQLPFSVAATDVWSTFSVDWAFGDGATASGPALQHAYRNKGQYTVTATGRDALGNTTPLSASTAIAALRVSKASLLHRTFRDGARSTLVVARRRRAPRGTKIRFRLPIAATVRIAVERRAAGRRVGRRCVKATRKNRRRNACARYIRALPILRRAGHAGANTVAFSGRVRGRALRPRRYRFTLTATGAGGARSKAVHLAFRVVR